jgi:hypothetical protein
MMATSNRYTTTSANDQCQEEVSEEEVEGGLQVYPPSIQGITWKLCKKLTSTEVCFTQ